MKKGKISEFIERHFIHFNAASLVDGAKGYLSHLEKGGKMMITLAGAMSTAELGKSLAEMIRKDKVHIITCTGANLEEDVFNLVAHTHYKRISHYRDLTPKDERELLKAQFNRVTDTCIPEEEAMRRIEHTILRQWKKAQKDRKRFFPHEYFYQLFENKSLEKYFEIDKKDSWLLAAYQKKIPIVVPGWEDSTIGNVFAAHCMEDGLHPSIMKSGVEYMMWLADWYTKTSRDHSLGFFQIGGGIAGDFPICVVPMLHQDLRRTGIPVWGYFCQISDSTTSYGSYSGAVPNEKITWGKLEVDTPKYIIESDASIVAPLMFAWILEW